MSRLKYILKKNRDKFISEFDGECPICGNGNCWVGSYHDTGDVYAINCTRCGFTAGYLNNGWITLQLKRKEHRVRYE